MKTPVRALLGALWLAALLLCATGARASDLPEYRLKAAFVYNFMLFTEWPAVTGGTLNLCILGKDPFGPEIDGLQGKPVAGRSVAVHRKAAGESLKDCQAVFIAASVIDSLPRVLQGLKGQPTLTLADSPGAMRHGVALNMAVAQGKVTFEANLQAARGAGLDLSSKLLRLASEVQQ
jgi:YfiR/HmsC-like